MYKLKLMVGLVACTLLVACKSGASRETGSITSVAATCSPSTIQAGHSCQCSAAVDGLGNFSSAVTWTVSEGTITPAGFLTVPRVPNGKSLTVTATSKQDPARSGSTTVDLLRFGSRP